MILDSQDIETAHQHILDKLMECTSDGCRFAFLSWDDFSDDAQCLSNERNVEELIKTLEMYIQALKTHTNKEYM